VNGIVAPAVAIEALEKFRGTDLDDLCDAASDASRDGGFGWIEPPPRDVMERFWRGVLMIPGRHLFVARLDGTIAGSVQLAEPPANNEAQSFQAAITMAFVAPWARGRGLARGLMAAAETRARARGFTLLSLDLRETQSAAIALFRSRGFALWGTNPHYARVGGRMVAGLYFTKLLSSGVDDAKGTPNPP
jgi:ribosomal protein S18 acetylase RimI-like enzyme